MDNLERIQNFFDSMVNSAEQVKNNPITKKHDSMYFNKYIDTCVIMCLGVAQFAQTIGVDFDAVAPMYDDTKNELEKMKEVL